MFCLNKGFCDEPIRVVSALDGSEGIQVIHDVETYKWKDDTEYWYFMNTCDKLRDKNEVEVRVRGQTLQLHRCPMVSILTDDELLNEKVMTVLEESEDIKLIPSSDKNLLHFYCRPQDALSMEGRSVKVRGKVYYFVIAPVPNNRPVPSFSTNTLERECGFIESPTASSGIQYFIELYHDAENCTCPQSANLNALGVHTEVVRQVLARLLGSRQAADAVDITASVVVKWYYILCEETANAYNKPSSQFMAEMLTLQGIKVGASAKKDGVDTEMKKLMASCGQEYEGMTEAMKAKRVVVVLSGDRDFAQSVRSLRQKGMTVMLIYNHDKTSEAFRSLFGDNVIGNWSDLRSACTRRPSLSDTNPKSISRLDRTPSPPFIRPRVGAGHTATPSVASPTRDIASSLSNPTGRPLDTTYASSGFDKIVGKGLNLHRPSSPPDVASVHFRRPYPLLSQTSPISYAKFNHLKKYSLDMLRSIVDEIVQSNGPVDVTVNQDENQRPFVSISAAKGSSISASLLDVCMERALDFINEKDHNPSTTARQNRTDHLITATGFNSDAPRELLMYGSDSDLQWLQDKYSVYVMLHKAQSDNRHTTPFTLIYPKSNQLGMKEVLNHIKMLERHSVEDFLETRRVYA